MPFSSYRIQFPFTVDRIYLNHAAVSPLSSDAREKMDWFINNRSFGEIEFFEEIEDIRERTRILLSRLINGEKDNISYVTSASEGLNLLAQSLKWKRGDQIILTDIASPATVYPFMNLKDKGVELVFIKSKRGCIHVEDVEKAITPRTKMLAISFVEFLTGFRNDMLALGALCKKNNVLYCVDASQGLGAIPFDVKAWHIDYLVCSGHKWLLGPIGVAFMYIRPELLDQLNPVFAGYSNVKTSIEDLNYKMELLPDGRKFEYGTQNCLGICGLWAALEQLDSAGIPTIEQHLLILGQQLIERLADFDMKFIGSSDPFYWSGIYSFKFPDAEELLLYLKSKNVICSVLAGHLRFSPHFYNNRDDIIETIELIAQWHRIH